MFKARFTSLWQELLPAMINQAVIRYLPLNHYYHCKMNIWSKAGRNTERSVGFGKERASLDNKARGSLSPQVILNLTHLRKLGWQFVRRTWSSLFLRKEAQQSPDDIIPVFSTFHFRPVRYYSGFRWAHKPFRTITPLFLDRDWKWTHIPLYI